MSEQETAPPPHPQQDSFGCGLLILTFVWLMAVLGITQTITLFLEGYQLILAALIEGLLLGVPLLLLTIFWKTPRYRAIAQSWLLAVGYMLILTPQNQIMALHDQWDMALNIVLTTGYGIIIWLMARRQAVTPSWSGTLPALGLVGLFAWSWLRWGAFGSPLDILLALGTGLSFGLVASLIISHFWLKALEENSPGVGWDIITGGFVIGTTLHIMGTHLGFAGAGGLLGLMLPALGWAAMGISLIGQAPKEEQPGSYTPAANWPALTLFIGLMTALPLMLIDPDGLIIFARDPLLRYGYQAAMTTLLVGWLLGIVVFMVRNRLPHLQANGLWLSGAAVVWLVGVISYAAMGQVGIYGDRLFIIMKEQADLSAASEVADYDERRRTVYQTLTAHAERTQADLRATLDGYGLYYRPYYLVNAVEVEGGLVHQWWLARHPDVARILISPRMRPLPNPMAKQAGDESAPDSPPWNLHNIGAPRVWEEFGVRGAGIVIGQSDSGIQFDHPELQDSYRGGENQHAYNWLDPWHGTQQPQDFSGHGTHTLGSILGNNVGVAPDASWFGCANLSRNLGNPALYLDCMQFMLAPYPPQGDPFADGDPTQAAHVLNNSWSCPPEEGCDLTSLQPAMQALRAAGIFSVVSAGNDGPACGTVNSPPALYDAVFSVGAVDEENDIAIFSSIGPANIDGQQLIKPDIVAPGVDILSAYPRGSYSKASGTSMAGPHVVGVVALLWSANPQLIGDIERTEQILRETAQPYTGTVSTPDVGEMLGLPLPTPAPEQEAQFSEGSCAIQTDTSVYPNNVVGYGIVDAYAAVKQAREE